MRVVAEGCSRCDSKIDKEAAPVTAESDPMAEVWVNGMRTTGVAAAWPGRPGWVIQYWEGHSGKPHLCDCTPSYRDNEDGTTNDPHVWRQLVEYDRVEVRYPDV